LLKFASFLNILCEPTVTLKTVENEMNYRISYADGWTPAMIAREGAVIRSEYFATEYEALNRARELIESGVHHGVVLYDGSGGALAGVLLQLKLGASVAD
jgi:hypothetical protein